MANKTKIEVISKTKLKPQASFPKETKNMFLTKSGTYIVFVPGMYARPWNNEFRVGIIGCIATNELAIPAEDVERFIGWLESNRV